MYCVRCLQQALHKWYSMLTCICCLANFKQHSKSPLEQRVPLQTHANFFFLGGGITSSQQRGGGGASYKILGSKTLSWHFEKKKHLQVISDQSTWLGATSMVGWLSLIYQICWFNKWLVLTRKIGLKQTEEIY